nr:hypothetical protein [Streptomyces coelicoflavus]
MTARVDALIAALPRQRWKRISGGLGTHGERIHDWARIAIRPCWADGLGHWALTRRGVADPVEIVYYLCCGPATSRLKDLVKVAATRWTVEEYFQTAKGECGLDCRTFRRDQDTRRNRSTHAHRITLMT